MRVISMKTDLTQLSAFIESVPHPMEVFDRQGYTVLINHAMRSLLGQAASSVVQPEAVIGNYNILTDPAIIALGGVPRLKQAFERGEAVYFENIPTPLADLQKTYNIQNREYEASYADISVFPLKDDDGQAEYMIALLIMKLVYQGRGEIERAKRYLEDHWQEPFSLG
jgi:PAS domain-containing protein